MASANLKQWRADAGPQPLPAPRFRHQSTPFTCGPACLLMALDRADAPLAEELDYWRNANILFNGRGPAGCSAAGLARLAVKAGRRAGVWTIPKGPESLASVRNPVQREQSRALQDDEIRRAKAEGIIFHEARMEPAEIRAALSRGARIISLVSTRHLHGDIGGHWVLVYAADDRHVWLHDPWYDHIAAPYPWAVFDRIRRYGRNRAQSMVVVEK